jgi:hypothetical protein
MKKKVLSGILKKGFTFASLMVFGLTMQLVAQSLNDQKQILQKCIDLPELQQYYPLAADGNHQQVYIMQYPFVFPDGIEVSKFGKPVQIVGRAVIVDSHAMAYFLFHTFSLTANKAYITFDFYNNYPVNKTILQGNIVLNKTDNTWTINDSKLTGR